MMLYPANRAMILQTDCDSVAKPTDSAVITKSKNRLGLETAHPTRFGSQGNIPKGLTKKGAIQSFQYSAVMMVPKTREPWIRRTKLLLWLTTGLFETKSTQSGWRSLRLNIDQARKSKRSDNDNDAGWQVSWLWECLPLSLESPTNNTNRNRNRNPKLLDQVA